MSTDELPTGENLSYVYHEWYNNKENYKDGECLTELFDEFIIVSNIVHTWLVPFIGSEPLGRAVFGPREEVSLEYFYYSSESILEKLAKLDAPLSRPVSGRACAITKVETGETIYSIALGCVDDYVSKDILTIVEDFSNDHSQPSSP